MIIAYYSSGLLKTTLFFIFSLSSLTLFMSNLSNFIKVFFSLFYNLYMVYVYDDLFIVVFLNSYYCLSKLP